MQMFRWGTKRESIMSRNRLAECMAFAFKQEHNRKYFCVTYEQQLMHSGIISSNKSEKFN